ncbi:hypothetical protein GCM10010954_10800 [Halobacillus andaensis]|uniref:Uncharacterized protein n=1 Tax=Halobacillus andaensis TaxID=1176239 RepID=A0A917B2L7_HALAA|nr:hypothetical protein [Halobacillus andaensis]MBP2003871.1 hypothetical protein [Halobacillus andaensis]GGF13884.1 hypothetical protein GCM10010954_10800 [Halobacillus andaensis]
MNKRIIFNLLLSIGFLYSTVVTYQADSRFWLLWLFNSAILFIGAIVEFVKKATRSTDKRREAVNE